MRIIPYRKLEVKGKSKINPRGSSGNFFAFRGSRLGSYTFYPDSTPTRPGRSLEKRAKPSGGFYRIFGS